MSIQNTRRMNRRPTHPGEMLREEFMPEFNLTTAQLADDLGVSKQTVNELLRERRALSSDMALRLARYFDTTPEYWLNLQRAVDIYDSRQTMSVILARIQPIAASVAM